MLASRTSMHDPRGYSNYMGHYADPGDTSSLGKPTNKMNELAFLFAKNEPADPNVLDNIEYHTHQYPHAFKGKHVFLGSLTFGLEMNSSMDFVNSNEHGIPIFYTDEQNFTYKKYYFTRGLMDLVPEEAPARYLRFRETSGSFTSQRYAIAHYVESNWFWEPEGQLHFGKTVKQISNTVRLTIQMQAVASVFKARVKLYEHEIRLNLLPTTNDWTRILKDKAENFAIAQKSKDGMFNAIVRSKQILGHRNVNPNAIWLPYGGKLYFKDILSKPADVHTIVTTPQTIASSRSNPDDINYFMGIRICEIEDFTYDEGRGLPVNPARGEAAFGQYVLASGHDIGSIDVSSYRSDDRNVWMMNYVQDKHVPISIKHGFDNCYVFDNPDDPSGDYGVGYHLGFAGGGGGGGGGGLGALTRLRKATPIDDGVPNSLHVPDLFGVREADSSNGMGTGNKSVYRFANFLGEMSRYYLKPELIEAMAKKVVKIYSKTNLAGDIEFDSARCDRELSPYHVSTMFQKEDVNREDAVKQVVDTLFEDIEGIQLIPVTFGEGMFADDDHDRVQENFVSEVVGGRYTDRNGNRFFSDPGELNKRFAHPATDLYGIDRSINKYNQMSRLPTNLYGHLEDTASTYPKGKSNLLTNLLYLRGIVMRENDDYNILRRKMVATGHELVREHGHNVHIHEFEETVQSPPLATSAEHPINVDMDIDVAPTMVATGTPIRGNIDHTKPVFDGISKADAIAHWEVFHKMSESAFSDDSDSAMYTKVVNFGTDRENRLLMGKTFATLAQKDKPMAQVILRDLAEQVANKSKSGFSKVLKEAHYKFADHDILPVPTFSYENDGMGATASSLAAPPLAPSILHTPVVATGAPIRIKRQVLTAIPSEHSIDVLNSVNDGGAHYANNKKLTAHVGIFKMDEIMKFANLGARIIPLDENYKPIHPDGAILTEENPKHSFEISNAHNENKSFEIKFAGMVGTGHAMTPRRHTTMTPAGSIGSRSVLNSDRYKDMETELLTVLSRRSPNLMTWVLMSKEGSSDESKKFKLKGGTLSSFIINGPRFQLDPAADTAEMARINGVIRDRQRDIKRDVPIPSLDLIANIPNALMDPIALKDAYVQTVYPNANADIAAMVQAMRDAYAVATFSPVHMRAQLTALMDADSGARKRITDARFRFFISSLDICSSVWNELFVDVGRAVAVAVLNAPMNINAAMVALKVVMAKYNHNQLIAEFIRRVFLVAGVPLANNVLTLRVAGDANTTFGLVAPAAPVAPAVVAVAGTTWDMLIAYCASLVENEDFTNTTRVFYDSVVSASLLMNQLSTTDSYVLQNREMVAACKTHNVNMSTAVGGNPMPGTPVQALKRANDLVTAKVRSETTTMNVTLDRLKTRVANANILDISYSASRYIQSITTIVNTIINPIRRQLTNAPDRAAAAAIIQANADVVANLAAIATMVRTGARNTMLADIPAVAGNAMYTDAVVAAYHPFIAGRLAIDEIFLPEITANIVARIAGGAAAAAAAVNAAMAAGAGGVAAYVIGSFERLTVARLVAVFAAAAYNVSEARAAGLFDLDAIIETPDQAIRNEILEKVLRPYTEPALAYLPNAHYLRISPGVIKGRSFSGNWGNIVHEHDVTTNAVEFTANVMSAEYKTRRLRQKRMLSNTVIQIYDLLIAETDNILLYVVAATVELIYLLSCNSRDVDKQFAMTKYNAYLEVLSRTANYTYSGSITEQQPFGYMEIDKYYGVDNIRSRHLPNIDNTLAAALNDREEHVYKTVYLTLKTLKMVLMKGHVGEEWVPNTLATAAVAANFKLCSLADTSIIIDKVSKMYLDKFTTSKCRLGGAEIALDWEAYNQAYSIPVATWSGLYATNKIGEFMDEVVMKSKTCSFGRYRNTVPFILQNNTQFYWDVYRVATHIFDSGFTGPMKNIVAHGKFKEIGDMLKNSMQDFDEGRLLITEAAKYTYGSIDYAARQLIWSMFGSTTFSEKVREVLGKLDSLRSSFKNLMKTVKMVFDMHFTHVFDYSNNPTVLGTATYAQVDTTNVYDGAFTQLGVDIDMDGGQMPPARRNLVTARVNAYTGAFTSYRTPRFDSNDGLAVRLRQLLKSVILSDELPLGIPSLICDIFILGSIERRTAIVNSIRKDFYSSYFVDMFKNVGDIDINDWRFSELEHFMTHAKNIDDPFVRKAFIKLLFCKPSKGFWNYVIRNDIIFPFDLVYARPYVKMRTCSGVIADWRNGRVGKVAVGTPHVAYEDDGKLKTHSLHLHNYICSILDGVDALLFLDHLWAEDFICGHGTTFFNKAEMASLRDSNFRLISSSAGITEEHPSMYSLLLPYGTSDISDVIDIRGKYFDDFNRKVPLQFNTTKAFFDISGVQTNATGAHPYYPRSPDTNFICYRTHYKYTHPKVNGFIVNLSSCPLGINQYDKMVSRVIRRSNINEPVFKDMGYENMTSTLNVSMIRA